MEEKKKTEQKIYWIRLVYEQIIGDWSQWTWRQIHKNYPICGRERKINFKLNESWGIVGPPRKVQYIYNRGIREKICLRKCPNISQTLWETEIWSQAQWSPSRIKTKKIKYTDVHNAAGECAIPRPLRQSLAVSHETQRTRHSDVTPG